jgi:hypothetical protein
MVHSNLGHGNRGTRTHVHVEEACLGRIRRGQLGTRSWVRTPTVEVNDEMRIPHGSDWPSIREAGMKAGNHPNPMGWPASRVAMRRHTNVRLSHRHECTCQRGLIGRPKTGKATRAGSLFADRFSLHSDPVDSTTLRLHKTSTRNGVTISWLPSQVDTTGRDRLTACHENGRMVQEAKAQGNAWDTQTWTTTER